MSTNSQRFKSSGVVSDANTTPVIVGIDPNLSVHFIAILFFSDENHAVVVDKATMTGSVTFVISEDGREFGTVSDGLLTLGSSMYNRPSTNASAEQVKATFSSVAGATHYEILVSSFAG